VNLLRLGRTREAIQEYESALRVDPDYPSAQNNLAWLLATLAPADGGDAARAVSLARRACESTGYRLAAYLDTLAAAYAADGQFNEAVTTARKAIQLAQTRGESEVAKEIEARLELYRSGQAYRR
jgi:spermidine synthase